MSSRTSECQDRRAGHVGHEAPFDLHHRHPRIGREKAHVGTERELEATAESDAVHGRDHGNRQLAPSPYRLLRKVRLAMGALGEIAIFATRNSVTALLLHGGKSPHIETGAERAAFAREHDDTHALFLRKPVGCGNKGLEHRLIERIHLVRAHQAHVGDAFRDRDRDALFHG
ncbi:hypothetical protein ABIF62_009372 [Bradyrhizobium japonicum]